MSSSPIRFFVYTYILTEVRAFGSSFLILHHYTDFIPIFVRTPEHIKAHLLICMIALTVVRIIQNKIVSFQNKNNSKKHNWELGLNSDKIQSALNKWTISYLNNGYYRFNDINNKDLKLILDSFNIKIPIKLYKPMELKNKYKSFNVGI